MKTRRDSVETITPNNAQFIRIRYMRQRGMGGHENMYQETAVLNIREDLVESHWSEAKRVVLAEGFRPRIWIQGKLEYYGDPYEWIAPGAIVAVAPCNQMGYTEYDLDSRPALRG